ncbi:hypothetical protein F4680DRAFT_422670 [Xylaria scruposa]|nr:hypothetical protein F4680DRAFT_422670 [Xylaria scruposa]
MESSGLKHTSETFRHSLSHIYQRMKNKNMSNPVEPVPAPKEKKNMNPVELVPAPEDANVDIVFIPGLGEHQLQAWTADDDNRTVWPSEFLPDDVKHARILAFKYDSTQVTKHADDLCNKLHRFRLDSKTTGRPIILVAHSLGGIVPAQVLVKGRESPEGSDLKSISQKIQGMVFFGTPFRDSKKKKFPEIIEKLIGLYKLGPDKDAIVQESKVLCDSFPKALGQHLQKNKQVGVMAFFESGQGARLVDKDAATIPSPDEETTHGTLGNIDDICSLNPDLGKFDEKDNLYYKKVAATLQELAKIKESQDKGNGQGRVFNVAGNVENLVGGDWNGDQLCGEGGGPVTKGNVTNMNLYRGNSSDANGKP